jgi:hypothetical protein
MWAIQAAGAPLFLRKTGRFGSLQTARLYQCEGDAQYTINYNALDFCIPIRVSVSCEVKHTEDAARLGEVLKKSGIGMGRHRAARAASPASGEGLPCRAAERAIENIS